MDQVIFLSKRSKFFLLMLGLAFLCWGRLLFLKGIWWDDWAWVWHYFGSSSLSEFIAPLKSLRHPLDGFLFFLNFKLLDIIPEQATNIWNIGKFVFFVLNPFFLYFILKGLMDEGSILPETVALVYLVSPIVNNLCTVEFGRRLYMFFFLLSILFSIWSVTKDGIKIPYYLSAIFFSIIPIFGLESFLFFELARPAVIYYLLSKKSGGSYLKNARQATLYWAPFFMLGSVILFYNIGFMKPRSGVYAHSYDLSVLPSGQYVLLVIHRYIKSLVYLFGANVYLFFKGIVSIKDDIWMLLTASFAALFVILSILKEKRLENNSKDSFVGLKQARTVTIFGIFLTLLGLFPYMVVRGAIGFGVESRHALLASLGFSIFVPSLLLWLYYSGLIKKTLYCFLFGGIVFLGVFHCNAASEAYHDDWQQQRSFWRQFMARVPDIKDNTYLVVDMPRDEKMYFGSWRGSYEFSAPMNLLYARSRDKNEVNKYFAESMENALNTNIEWSYVNNKEKTEGQYMSFQGVQKYYPKNLVLASYHDGVLYLNSETHMAGISGFSATQILGGKEKGYPFRWIIK